MYKGEQPSPWQMWANQVQHKLVALEDTVIALQKQLTSMEERLAQVENKPQYAIENIAYHFDQLKVEQLDGTLNIGMTSPFASPDQLSSIDQLAVPTKWNPTPPHKATDNADYRTNLNTQIHHIWQQESPRIIQGLEQQYNVALDPHHRNLLTKDIAQQLDGRSRYYLDSLTTKYENNISEHQLHEEVTKKTIDDSKQALIHYFDQLTKQQ